MKSFPLPHCLSKGYIVMCEKHSFSAVFKSPFLGQILNIKSLPKAQNRLYWGGWGLTLIGALSLQIMEDPGATFY